MNPTPYIVFQGNCREAMTIYAEVFGAEIEMIMKASEMPDYQVPPEKADWIAHCGLRFAEGQLYGSDDIMGGSGEMSGCSVMMELPSNEEGRAVFDRLAEGGNVEMSYQPTFWSPGFGTLTDRFGIRWMISTSQAMPEG